MFTNDSEIRGLNQEYRNKGQPTDVLSFSQLEGNDGLVATPLLGDIVISLETASRQAEERGLSIEEELLRLVIHGLLHLAGYEHENVASAVEREMQDQEDRLQNIFIEQCRFWVRS